jgi:hypothetical protein
MVRHECVLPTGPSLSAMAFGGIDLQRCSWRGRNEGGDDLSTTRQCACTEIRGRLGFKQPRFGGDVGPEEVG